MVKEMPKMAFADGHLMVDLVKRQALVTDEFVHLTSREWDILVYLVQYRGGLMTKPELLRAVWGDQHEEETNYPCVYISQLCHKTEPQQAHNRCSRTEVGVGYRMVLDEE